MYHAALFLPAPFAVTLAVATGTGVLVAAVARREGGAFKVWAGPLGIVAFAVALAGNRHGSAGVLRPYFGLCVIGILSANSIWCGAKAWRIGGRWRSLHLPLVTLALALPLAAIGWMLAGPYGAFIGLIGGWAFAFPWLCLAWMWLTYKGGPQRIRAAAWGASVAIGPMLGLEFYRGDWWHAGISFAGLLYAWALDYVTRTRGPWDGVLPAVDAWIDARASRGATVAGAVAAVYPALVAIVLRQSAPPLIDRAITHAFKLGQVSRVDALLVIVATATLLVGVMAFVHSHLPDPSKRARVFGMACIPLAVWTLAMWFVPLDFAIAGVFWSGTLTIAICGSVFLESSPKT